MESVEVEVEESGVHIIVDNVNPAKQAKHLHQVDDGQTNSVSFDTICLAVKRRS
jgi:hypothetical protein